MSNLKDAKHWLDLAEASLRAAKLLDETMWPKANHLTGFNAQQAAEQALKSVLAYHDKSFRKTHDIDDLLGQVWTVKPSIQLEDKMADKLTTYAVVGRYKQGGYEVTETDARLAIKAVEKLIVSVHQALGIDYAEPENTQPSQYVSTSDSLATKKPSFAEMLKNNKRRLAEQNNQPFKATNKKKPTHDR